MGGAGFCRKLQIFAGNHRKPQIGNLSPWVCPLQLIERGPLHAWNWNYLSFWRYSPFLYDFRVEIGPFSETPICSYYFLLRFLEGLFAILAECSQFCWGPLNRNSRGNPSLCWLGRGAVKGDKNCEHNICEQTVNSAIVSGQMLACKARPTLKMSIPRHKTNTCRKKILGN